MPYTNPAGVPVPSSTDAYSPGTQFKTWTDADADYQNRVVRADDTARNAISAPVLRTGLACYVTATKLTWVYDGTSWVKQGASDSGWITPTLAAGWSTPGGNVIPLQYRKVGSRVYFRGAATGGSTADPLFTLPSDYRPGIPSGKELYFMVGSGTGTSPPTLRIVIRQNGTINAQNGSPNFDPISFMAD